MNLKHILFSCILLNCLLLSCNNLDKKNIFKAEKVSYYEDIDFSTFEGINPVNKKEGNAYIEIVSKDQDKVILEIHSKIGNEQEYYSYKESFSKINDHYYQYKEDNDDNPFTLIKKYTYIKNDFILIIENTTHKKKPEYSRITKIIPSKNFIEEIKIEEELVDPNPNTDFDFYKSNPNVFTVTEKKLEIKNNELVVCGKITNFKNNASNEIYTTYYEGYPNTSSVNNYWNLYKYFLGKDLRHD